MRGRSKRGVCCPGPQTEDLSPRGRQHEPCGRDKDGEGGREAVYVEESQREDRNRKRACVHLFILMRMCMGKMLQRAAVVR